MDLLLYDDLQEGQTWISPGRTITEADIVGFACLTGDFNPMHVDQQFAQSSPFRRRIAHGLLGLSIGTGLSCHSPPVETVAFVGMDDWEFCKPIYIGDTIRVRTEVTQKLDKGRRAGQLSWKKTLVNQDDQVVQKGQFRTLVRRQRGKPMRPDEAGQAPAPSHELNLNALADDALQIGSLANRSGAT